MEPQRIGRFIVWLFIVGPAIVDWAHGFLLYEAGIDILASLYRLGILVVGLVFLLLRPTWTMLFVVLAYLLYIVGAYLTWSATSQLQLAAELRSTVNIVFLPMCYMILSFATRYLGVSTDYIIRQVLIYGRLTAIIVVLSLLFDIGVPTYSTSAGAIFGFGSQSYYVAGNVLGLTLVVSLAVALHLLIRQFTFRHLLDVSIIYAGAFSVGSRTGMIISSMLLATFLLYFIFLQSGHHKQRFAVAIVIVPLLAYGGLKTYELISQYSRMLSKVEAVLAGEIRSEHASTAWQYVAAKRLVNRIGGSSFEEHTKEFAYYSPKKGVISATAETDPVDVIGAYGLIGLVVLYLPYLLGVSRAAIRYMRTSDFASLISVTALILLIGHSIIAGHVLFSSKSIQFACIFIFLALSSVRTPEASSRFH